MRLPLSLLAALTLLAPVHGEDWQWAPLTAPLPGKLVAPAVVSQPLEVGNSLLQKIKEKLYEVPWAPGEAILLQPRPSATTLSAFGFWRGPREYQLLVRQGGQWRSVTPLGTDTVKEPRLAYFGHEVSGQPVNWTGPARIIAVGSGGAEGLEITRVPLFEAGCTLMVLERGERELRQARDFLGWMRPAAPQLVGRVADCQAEIDATREQLRQQTRGLLDSYQALPEPRYALENLAFFSRLYQRSKGFDKIGDSEVWTRVFYGRPEFAPCVEVRKAAQEALWAQRPQTLAAEVGRVFGPQAAFGASITHGLVKFRRDRPVPEPLRTSYRMVLAREEHESFQVAIAALGQGLQNVTVDVAWEGPGPHPEVVLRPVGYVETKLDPDNLTEYTGWWADPLMPPGPVNVAAGETQPIWGSVQATRSTPAGDHMATITVRAEGLPPLKLKLTAHVLDFSLGFTHLPSLLSLRLNTIQQFYKLESLSQDVKRRWYEFCLQYRMNPNNIYSADFYPEEENLDFCIERGFNAMVMMTPPLRRTTRNNADNLQVWVSDDNQAFRQAPAGYTVTHDDQGSIVIAGLEVTARYLKVHSTLSDDAYEFSLKTLEKDRIVAYDRDECYTGPAAYVGREDGTKPLLSFGATWGAALDYRNSSLGVDLGQPRRVTRLVLRGAYGSTLERVKRFYEVAKAHGLGDRAYVYGFDEWGDVERYGDIQATYDALKAVAPGIKASSTVVHPVPPIDRTIDAWCPALCYEFPEYKQARQRGQEVWYYEGGCPYDPYPTHELLDVPAVEARAFFWVAWRYQYTGWLHWELNVWSNNMNGDKRWPDVPWNPARSGVRNGEVGRIYPGPTATPLPSVRLENMRDGIEDYDYLWLLRDRVRKLPAAHRQRIATEKLINDTIMELCPSRAHFERDPARVLSLHEKLGLALERLSKQ
ncbi:MAG: glycoside hydrolase domain-containing protein [Armatimonadia bacterium]